MLVLLEQARRSARAGPLRARVRLRRKLGPDEQSGMEDRRLRRDERQGRAPHGSIGFRWGEKRQVEPRGKEGEGRDVKLKLSLAGDRRREIAAVGFPYFGGSATSISSSTAHGDVLVAQCAGASRIALGDGEAAVATVFDLKVANYGVDRGFGGERRAVTTTTTCLTRPAWQEKITGVTRDQIITVARQFADNAEKTHGRSMVIIGAGDQPLVPHGHELPRRSSTC